MKKVKSLKTILGLIFSFIIIAFIVYYFSTTYFDNRVDDFFVTLTTDKSANKNTVLIIIDDKSIATIRYPWQRTLYTDMFEYLQNYAHVKLILFDAIIVSPDNQNPKSDKEFFKHIKNIKDISASFDVHSTSSAGEILPQQYMSVFDKKFQNIHIKDSKNFSAEIYNNVGITNFLPSYLKNINTLGSISVPTDIDGAIREFLPIVKVNDKIYPSLPLLAFSKITGHEDFIIKDGYLCTIDNCKSLKMPISKYGKTGIKWYKPYYDRTYSINYNHKKYSAIDIINSYYAIKKGQKPVINPEEFRDKIVVIGAAANAHALEDVKITPILQRESGSDIVATFLDNLLNNEFTVWSSLFQDICIFILITIVTFALILNCSLALSSLSCACIFLTYFLIYWFLISNNIIIPLVTTFLIQVLAMLFGYSYRFILEDTKKKKIQHAMGMYLSNDVMKNVVKDIDNVKLGGKRTEVTVLFADIRGFTSISEKLSPEEVTDILNEYFSEMEPIISKYKGVVNKFIGDAVLVIFNDPIYDKDHAVNAVKCADAMLKRVKVLQGKWENEGKPKIEIGVGINTGEVFVGNIGSQNRLEYTVIGDCVNLANRIESYNKVYRTRFLISYSTYQRVRNIVDVIKIKEVSIRGKAKKIDIYEVLKLNNVNDEQ